MVSSIATSTLLERLGILPWGPSTFSLNSGAYGSHEFGFVFTEQRKPFNSINPSNGEVLGRIVPAGVGQYDLVVRNAQKAFLKWRMVPAPKRGQFIREIGEELRRNKDDLGALVSLEMGKIISEGCGEVQEMIDMADYVVGLSRQLCGVTTHSELPLHRMYEQWHPLGVVGVITAFNFPVAVWAWNAFVAAVCGDTVIWKPSTETPLCAIAVQNICNRVAKKYGADGVFNLVIGTGFGEKIACDVRIPLVSFTGSCATGRQVATNVAGRFGTSLLELGGNNAIIVMDDADLDLATGAIFFGAVGTAGQRCTSTRRVIMHEKIADELTARLLSAYAQVKIGDPLDPTTLMGPLVNDGAVETMFIAINEAVRQGGHVLTDHFPRHGWTGANGHFVLPTIIKASAGMKIMREETFAPILYVVTVKDLDEAITLNNNVSQGLSSAICTRSLDNAERFLSALGSDCGIANVNNGTSGAEIGLAFGGEKETGGGREAGSDSWKAYMRRQTVRINYSRSLPLAQGVEFDLKSN